MCSAQLERLEPKATRRSLDHIPFSICPDSAGNGETVHVPLSQYLRAIEALEYCEGLLKQIATGSITSELNREIREMAGLTFSEPGPQIAV